MWGIWRSKTYMECSVYVNTCNMYLTFSHKKYSSDDDKRKQKVYMGKL